MKEQRKRYKKKRRNRSNVSIVSFILLTEIEESLSRREVRERVCLAPFGGSSSFNADR
jgi:hypothetical protein